MPLFRNFLFLIGVVQSVFTATSSVSRLYERPEEGFCYQADHYPFGKGLNVQIRVPDVGPLLHSLSQHEVEIFLPIEDRWYRVGAEESGNRQFVVADPDGYLLRFYQRLGTRPVPVEDESYEGLDQEIPLTGKQTNVIRDTPDPG